MVESMNQVAHALGKLTVAECVEIGVLERRQEAALDQLRVVAHDSPALAARNHLTRLKTEAAQVSERAAFLPIEFG